MERSEAILDAGPLIHLTELEALDAIGDFSDLFVPQGVWEEVAHHQPGALKCPGIRLQEVSAPLPSPSLLALGRALSLDKGEMEALSLMDLHPRAILLTDDSAARMAAEHRGVRAHGTIGLLIRSVRTGRRTRNEVIDLLKHLRERSTLHIRPSLLAEIIQDLEKEWNSSSTSHKSQKKR
jgi:predicted nucleic acid-binding protein